MIFNGVDFSQYFVISKINRDILPSINNTSISPPGMVGNHFVRDKIETRPIGVKLTVLDDTRELLRTKIIEIAQALYTNKPKVLKFADEDVFYYAKLSGGTPIDEILAIGEGTISFECFDPHKYALNPRTITDFYGDEVVSDAQVIPLPSDAKGQLSVSVRGLSVNQLIEGKGNSLEGWQNITSDFTLEDGFFKYRAVTNGQRERYSISIKTGDKFYISYLYKTTGTPSSDLGFRTYLDTTQVDILPFLLKVENVNKPLTKVSHLITSSSNIDNVSFRPFSVNVADTGFWYFQNIVIINLTQTFGAGNELTLEQCDKMFPNYLKRGVNSTLSTTIRSISKNLYKEPKSMEDINSTTANARINFFNDYVEYGQAGTYAVAYSQPIRLKPNTTYCLSVDGVKTTNYGRVQVRDIVGSGSTLLGTIIVPTTRNRSSATFTTPANGIVYIWYYVNTEETVGNMKVYSVQIENGTTMTEYEPYQSNSVTTPEIGKGLPNGTKDEFSVATGKHIQRIGIDSEGELFELAEPIITYYPQQSLTAYPNGSLIIEVTEDSTYPQVAYRLQSHFTNLGIETPCKLELNVTRPLDYIEVFISGELKFKLNTTFQQGDKVVIDTSKRTVMLNDTIDIRKHMSFITSEWFTITRGEFSIDTNFGCFVLNCTLEYRERWL